METLPGPKFGQKLHRDTAPKSFYRQEFADNRARQRGFDGSNGYKRRRVGPGLGFSQSTGGLQRNNSWFRRHFPLAAILPSPMRSMRDWLDARRQQIKPPAAQNWASQAEESYSFQVALALRLTTAASWMDDLHGFQIHNCCSTPLFSFRNTLKQRHIASGRNVTVMASVSFPGMKEQYETLRLSPGASEKDVKRAYRHLALQYHPDVCKGDVRGVQFHKINQAYETLMSSLAKAKQQSYSADYSVEGMMGINNAYWDEWEEWMGWEGAGTLDYSSHINIYA